METPAGLVEIEYEQIDAKVNWVKFANVKKLFGRRESDYRLP